MVTSHLVESIKFPLESRIWMSYQGQGSNSGFGAAVTGTLDKPIRIGRVLDDGSTEVTQFDYNGSGNLTKRVDPSGRETRVDYYSNQIDLWRVQQKTTSTSPPTFTTIAEFSDYNNQHLPKFYTDAAGKTTTYSYYPSGQLETIKDPLDHITSYEYDALGYLTRVVNPNDQTAVSFTPDAFSRVETRTDSEGHVIKFDYDALDRLTKETYPDGTTRVFTWDKLDLTDIKDRQSRHTKFEYDRVRNLRSITDALGRQTHLDYYPNGKLKSLVDPAGNTTEWTIDIQGRTVSKTFSGGGTVRIRYEARTSRPRSIIDPLGQTKRLTYWSDDRLRAVTYLNAKITTPSVAFDYDNFFPRLTSMTDGAGTTNYEYCPVGALGALKLKKEDGPYTNDTIFYAYDALGRMIKRDVDNSIEYFTYDNLVA